MIFRMLKKDLWKRRGINLILFLFIFLATIFLSSSVNNILVVSKGVDYYVDYANVPDVNVMVTTDKEKVQIDSWLNQKKQEGLLTTYEYNQLLSLPSKSVFIKKDQMTELDRKGASLYVGKMDVNYGKVYDQQGHTFSLKKGEIALSLAFMDRNHLQIGDILLVKVGSLEKEFTIAQKTKDAAFGSDMIGMTRLLFSVEDYQELETETSKMGLYYITTDQGKKLTQELENQSYDSVAQIVDKDTYKMVYSFDMIMSALLILIGICLIFIALLVLRFTLVFTLEEEYQEIGILKAIGFKNFAIKKIYLLKYFVLVFIGSLFGLLCSFPVSTFMVGQVSQNMIMESSNANYFVNILCSFLVVLFVLGFCYLSTRKLNKISAITAIRGGDTGERFSKKKGLSLSKRYHLPVSLVLAGNDILSHLKRYTVLLITFAISFILITIPLNTLNTMRSREMITKFGINPDSAVYLRDINLPGEPISDTVSLKKRLGEVKEELKEKGYDASLTATPIYFIKYNNEDGQKRNIMTIQAMGDNPDYMEYSKGRSPQLENEIAFSETILKEYSWKIGDTIQAKLGDEKKSFVITGTYSDYMQLGRSARLNPILFYNQEGILDYWSISVDFATTLSQEEVLEEMKEEFPEYEWITGQQFVDQNVGGIQELLATFLLPMTAMLCGVIMLITFLMEKLFLAREKGEVAMLKSVGFRYRTIASWQVLRMVLVALSSMAIAVPLSLLSNYFVLKPIFAVMGADVAIQIDPIRVYLIYPGILLIGIFVSTLFASLHIRKVHIRELNNLE